MHCLPVSFSNSTAMVAWGGGAAESAFSNALQTMANDQGQCPRAGMSDAPDLRVLVPVAIGINIVLTALKNWAGSYFHPRARRNALNAEQVAEVQALVGQVIREDRIARLLQSPAPLSEDQRNDLFNAATHKGYRDALAGSPRELASPGAGENADARNYLTRGYDLGYTAAMEHQAAEAD